MERSRCRSPSTRRTRFTERQRQYPAFIHACTKVNGRPPAQADMQRCFAFTAPSVHQMVLSLVGMTPEFWLNLQGLYDLDLVRASIDVGVIEPLVAM